MGDWTRVSKGSPCKICGRCDWCLYHGPDDDPDAVICPRVESPKRCGAGGWLHVIRDNRGPTWTGWRRTLHKAVDLAASQPAAAGIAAECKAGAQWLVDRPDHLERFAVGLGVTADALRRLGVGYSPRRAAWTFPMKSAAGNICGVRLRLSSGRKLSIKGGKEGLFLPAGIDGGGRLLIAEGPTDCAALLDLQFRAAGRPSCRGGVSHLVGLVGRLKPEAVVIVSDPDTPGRKGAAALAARLRVLVADIRVIEPAASVKDIRQWRRQGATAGDVERLIAAARPLGLEIETRTRKGRQCKKATARS